MEKRNVTNQLTKILDNNNENIDLTLSYSKLSDFDRNGAISLVRQSVVDNDGVKMGSLVDDLLFNDNDYFKDNYYIFDGEKPTATLGILCDIILKNYTEVPNVEEVLKIIEYNKFWNNIKKQDLLISYFNKEEFWNYLKSKFESKNKVLITTSEYNTAIELITVLKEHSYSKHILTNNFENIYQLKFEIEYKKFKIRGIIDITSIDHENKIIYLTDLKTGKNKSVDFFESFIKWRYYFQAAIYTLAFDEICKHFNLKDYKLAPFQFLYISKSDKIPLVYKTTKNWISAAFKGFTFNSNIYKGIDEIIDEIYWCWKNKQYETPKYIIENNGNIEINDKLLIINE
jgi:hypothetical protein